jgi:hypothetical protein
MSNRDGQEKACSAPHKSRTRPYDNRPRSGPGHAKRSTDTSTVRVVLPGEPPRLTSEAARPLLRILIKAHDRLADTDNPQGAAR